MKNAKIFFVLITLLWFHSNSYSQYLLDNQTSFLTISGTSTLHDWTIQVNNQSGKMTMSDDLKISALSVEVESESLKSGKKGMDKKTYKALNTNSHKLILFEFKNLKSFKNISNDKIDMVLEGDLTVNGKTKNIQISVLLTKKDGLIILDGTHALKMTDYNIKPPKALLGAIKTGDEIELSFKTIFKKSMN